MELLFGGGIAVTLLGLYVYAVAQAVLIVLGFRDGPLSDGFSGTMSTVGGLVSALVIAELAITKTGETPVARALIFDSTDPHESQKRGLLAITTGAYVVIWILVGLTAYIVGYLWYPGKLGALTNLGQAWLGLAVAAAYAYFGLNSR